MAIILAYLESKLAIIRWAVLGLSWIVIAWVTHHLDLQAQKASQLEQVQASLKETVKNAEIVHDVQIKTNALPVGYAAKRLQQNYSRD